MSINDKQNRRFGTETGIPRQAAAFAILSGVGLGGHGEREGADRSVDSRPFGARGILFYKTGRLDYNNGSKAVILFLPPLPRGAEAMHETERLYG